MAPHDPEVHEMGLLTPDPEPPPGAQRPKRSAWYTPHGWLWEISSMIASICCTLALAVLLSRVQDQPYENWRFYVGLNPTISALTTVARGTLLLSVSACLSQGKWLHFVKQSRLHAMDVFDQASRGPLGALTIVLKTKTYLGLPTVAAAITVLALAIGPFTQQVVTYDQGSVDVPSQRASFDYAHRYASGPSWLSDAGESLDPYGPTNNNLVPDLQWAIYRGLYQNQTSWMPSFSCPSDCRWPDNYTVLGVAGSCENVTTRTLATKSCVRSEDHVRNCEMLTPRGTSINIVIAEGLYRTVSALNSTSQQFLTEPVFQFGPQIATYAFYNTRMGGGPGTIDYTYQETVWECSLNFTANRYSQVSSASNEFHIGELEQIQLESGYTVEDGNTMFNQSGIPNLTISGTDQGALRGFFLSKLFTGLSLQGDWTPDSQLGCNSAFASNDAQAVTASLAKSMTDALQKNPASQRYTGSYAQAVTFVRVRWVWLILLGALEAAGVVLLVGTIIRAQLKQDVLLWKSSQSALLFSHIDSDGLLVPPKRGVRELEKETQMMRTQLSKG